MIKPATPRPIGMTNANHSMPSGLRNATASQIGPPMSSPKRAIAASVRKSPTIGILSHLAGMAIFTKIALIKPACKNGYRQGGDQQQAYDMA